ncbi:Protein snail [Gryllus bimaculatus]|nr:Protein snail [Gryllus bimaculatus]
MRLRQVSGGAALRRRRCSAGRGQRRRDGGAALLAHGCGECGRRYSTASNLARHRQTHRSPADKKARRCPHCDKLYVSMPAFSMHVRTHSQACKCPFCGKCFSRPWLLQGHIRTHTGVRRQVQPAGARADALQHQAARVLALRQAFALKATLQARGVFVRSRDAGAAGAERGAEPAPPPPALAAATPPPPMSFAITA